MAAGKPTAADKRKVEQATEALQCHHSSKPPTVAMGLREKDDRIQCSAQGCKGVVERATNGMEFQPVVMNAPTASPHFAQGLEQAMALVSQIAAAAQNWAACGTRVTWYGGGLCGPGAEGRRVQEARFPEIQVRNMFQALEDDFMDVESDEESGAPTEASDETKAPKEAKKERAKAA